MEAKFGELIKLQGQLGAVSSHQGRDEVELNKLKGENERLEAEVRNYKERESLKLKVKLLEKKKAWLIYREELDTYKKAANHANELKSQYEEAHEKFKPLEDEIAKKDRFISRSTDSLRAKVR
jgi:chromosome segregation ATPase